MESSGNRDPSPPADPEAAVQLDQIPLHSTNLLTVLDETGIIQYESPSIERLYGFDQDELIGESVTEYFHPDDREKVEAAYQVVVTNEGYTTETVEYRHEQADGTYRWVESTASANPTPEGHYVVNTRDISTRKERERRLQEANERLTEFNKVLSHDLRNPLHVAQSSVELARTERDSDYLAAAADAHQRMATLISELLAVSQSEQGVLETAVVQLPELLESCWETVPTADATLVCETDRQVSADSCRLRQLFENLFRNAVEHGSEDVIVTVGDLESGFYVADDGPGIPPAMREAVFEIGTSTTRTGTGIGLYIVDQVVTAHGWTLTITDGADGGARFEITDVDFE